MKATGVVRRIDNLGRLCMPKEILRTMHIAPGDPVELFVDDNSIVLRQYDSCGDMQQLLDNMESKIRLSDTLIPGKQLYELLDKLKEMRAILREENRE